MKRIALAFLATSVMAVLAYAGQEAVSGKEMKQVAPPPCPEWYADNEWNVSLWGAYAFPGTNGTSDWHDPFDLPGPVSTENIRLSADRYLEGDHAWGGGIDVKYFWHRYFGFGIEGFVLDASRTARDYEVDTGPVDGLFRNHDTRAVGAVLGTFTLRYPFRCSRFAPYAFAGGGAIFGGGEQDILTINFNQEFVTTHETDAETKALGQFGGGLEVRITPHVGWMTDFSWNVVEGPDNNFGMVRSGLTFAF